MYMYIPGYIPGYVYIHIYIYTYDHTHCLFCFLASSRTCVGWRTVFSAQAGSQIRRFPVKTPQPPVV